MTRLCAHRRRDRQGGSAAMPGLSHMTSGAGVSHDSHGPTTLVAMPDVRTSVRQPQSIARLRAVHARPSLSWQAARDSDAFQSCGRGDSVDRPRTCFARKDPDRLSGAHVVRPGDSAPGMARWACGPRETSRPSRFRQVQTFSPRNHVHTFRLERLSEIERTIADLTQHPEEPV